MEKSESTACFFLPFCGAHDYSIYHSVLVRRGEFDSAAGISSARAHVDSLPWEPVWNRGHMTCPRLSQTPSSSCVASTE